MLQPWQQLLYLTANSNFLIALKAFLASVTLLMPGYFLGLSNVAVTALLGIVAAVISEGDDSIKRRISNSLLSLCCFALVAHLITVLYPYPHLFVPAMAVLTFTISILGSLGKRYVSISFASLIIAVYTLLGLSNGASLNGVFGLHGHSAYPLLLVGGAAWYYLLSLLFLIPSRYHALREKLANIYFALSAYQHEKAKFFAANEHDHKAIRHTLATLNINVVNAMAECRDNLDLHIANTPQNAEIRHLIHLYQEAQELHEKTTSSHFHYQSLQDDLNNVLITGGFQQVLQQMAQACRQRGMALLHRIPYQHEEGLTWSLAILHKELRQLQRDRQLQAPLTLLFSNLNKANLLLLHSEHSDDNSSLAMAPQQTTPLRKRLREALSLSSPVFRHAIRLSIGITLGTLIVQHTPQGYWVVLTTLFVLQPSYSATRVKFKQRISGTLSGIIVGSLLLYLFPTERSQIFLLATSACLFFYYLRQDYSKAVSFITLLVLLVFNILYQQGYAVAEPRIIDTLIGCGIAYILSKLVLPNWQYTQFPRYLVDAITANQNYFQQIISQYIDGKNNDLPYRLSRRQAYVADSQLIASWRDMQIEPLEKRDKLNHVYDIARRNHAMLSALSALGVHRKQIIDVQLRTDLIVVEELICRVLAQSQLTITTAQPCQQFYMHEIENLLFKYQTLNNKHSVLLLQKLKQIASISEELQVMANDIKPLS
jgi:uncharacterized membrane protein (TIGR01666 family)